MSSCFLFCFCFGLRNGKVLLLCQLGGDDLCLQFDKIKIKNAFWIDSHHGCLQLPQSALCHCSAHGSVSQLSFPFPSQVNVLSICP